MAKLNIETVLKNEDNYVIIKEVKMDLFDYDNRGIDEMVLSKKLDRKVVMNSGYTQ